MTGSELKRLRRDALRIRQDQFAAMLGRKRPTVSEWERAGDKAVPTDVAAFASVLFDFPEVLNRLLAELIEEGLPAPEKRAVANQSCHAEAEA